MVFNIDKLLLSEFSWVKPVTSRCGGIPVLWVKGWPEDFACGKN
ncbi:hypothetical protein [uncultured Anaerovibrio sp.]|nr:hypothetical protein [uncultured Anaerovibrio sp.]